MTGRPAVLQAVFPNNVAPRPAAERYPVSVARGTSTTPPSRRRA